MKDLTLKQRAILEFIVEKIRKEGIAPTFREIGRRFGISSTNGVKAHLEALERKGYIKVSFRKGIELGEGYMKRMRGIPILGRVPAGIPIMEEECIEGYLELKEFFGEKGVFALRVKGESMKGAGIEDGDYVIVRHQETLAPGEIGVFFINEEATIKRFSIKGEKVILLPENPSMEPLSIEKNHPSFRIGGKVVGIIKKLSE